MLAVTLLLWSVLVAGLAVRQKLDYGLVFYHVQPCDEDKVIFSYTFASRNLGKGFVGFNFNLTVPHTTNGGKVYITAVKSGDSSFTTPVPMLRATIDACKFLKEPKQFASVLRTTRPPVYQCPIVAGFYQNFDSVFDPRLAMSTTAASLDDFYTYVGITIRIRNATNHLLACFEGRFYRKLLT